MVDTATIKSSMKRVTAVVITLFVGLCVLLFAYTNTARADIVSWTQYTEYGSSIEWMIDDDGVLTIRPISGNSGVLKYNVSDTSALNPPWMSYASQITAVSVSANATIELRGNVCRLFKNCSNLTSLDLSHFDTSNVTSFSDAFYNCKNLTSLDVSVWDVSNVTIMASMFQGCSSLTSLNMQGWNTSSVTNMNNMFNGCSSLTSLDVSHFDTSNVTTMSSMFYNCKQLASVDVDTWNTSNVTNMNSMFSYCTNLTDLDVANWDVSHVTNMSSMFNGCSNAAFAPTVANWNTSSVTNMSSMFYGCSGVSSFDVSGWNTSSVTSMGSMFAGCTNLSSLDVANWDVSHVTSMNNMFRGCSHADFNPDFSNWNTSSVTNMASMFSECYGASFNPNVRNWNTHNVTNMGGMFYDCHGAAFNPDVSQWDVSNVTTMSQMFIGCYGDIFNPDVSHWNTSSVTNMSSMFGGYSNGEKSCHGAAFNPDVSNWDVSHVTNMERMFDKCYGASFNPDFSNWNTSSVTTMKEMFSGCSNDVFNPDLSNWNTSSVTTMEAMFLNCSGAAFNPGVSGWNTSNVTTMYDMFRNCHGQSFNPDVSNWNVSSVTTMGRMFTDCYGDAFDPDFSNWNTSSLTSVDYMFENCHGVAFSPDVSNWDTSNLRAMRCTFYDCYGEGFTFLDLSSWDTTGVTLISMTFTASSAQQSHLQTVVLGERFSFNGNGSSSYTYLPSPPSSAAYTGKWVRIDDPDHSYTASDLARNYNASMAGTWVWEERPVRYTITFDGGVGVGSMTQATPFAVEDYTIPATGFFYPGKKVVGWTDGNGHTFDAEGTIPANTYNAGDRITLTAVWEDINKISEVAGGIYELELQPGFSATIPNIPAGVPYRVYEQTADGWVLVEQSNTSGVIQPLVTQIARFTNQYNPNITSAMIYGMKTIDGEAASAGEYTFELWEGSEKKQTVQNQDGGAVVFDPLTYDDEGSHTYTVREVAGSDTSVVYDSHEETVTVVVEKDSNSKLTATITYDGDGIKFNNRHNPGNLELTKLVDGQTAANADDEFTFKITLRNSNGEPVTDGVYIHYGE